jgi:hypothetical protein
VGMHLAEQCPTICHTPTFGIHVPHKDNRFIMSCMIYSWASFPSSSATTRLAHTLSTPTNLIWSGCTPFCCICWPCLPRQGYCVYIHYRVLVGARGRRPLWSFISFIFSYLLLFIWPLPCPPCPALSGRPAPCPCPCHIKCSTPPPVPHNIWGNDKRWGIFCFYYLLITAVW